FGGKTLIYLEPVALVLSRNVMACGKVLYEGHAVAAVAAVSLRDRRGGARPDRSRIRGVAARYRCRGGDEARRASAAR
ncbi:MAG TPA: hypothetical protein VFQ90_06430, partial [Stellaceae bacterium]|nr:hypothetical protein [Stellaceae bacterium]